MSELSQNISVETTATEIKNETDKKLQKKVFSLVLMFIMFVILFFAQKSGNETFLWASLVLTIASSGYLYSKN